jgi:uncharacterized membrane protein
VEENLLEINKLFINLVVINSKNSISFLGNYIKKKIFKEARGNGSQKH